jgi:hypothetical protein
MFMARFFPTFSPPPLLYAFWKKENSQDVSAGCHEWVPTVLTDLLKDLVFA